MLGRLALISGFVATAQAASYSIFETSQGQTFFDNWRFITGYDNTTTGDVIYSANNSLAYVASNGSAIMRVSTDFVAYNEKRNSVKIMHQQGFGEGTVFVLDATHLPVACSVWPALYFTAIGQTWPAGGEIDVLETQNRAAYNQMSLHTASTCKQASGVTQTGTVTSTDCDVDSSSNTGCAVQDTRSTAYGDGFNAAGGGAWAMEYASTGINIWFWTRSAIPSSLASGVQSVDTSTLGTPVAAYPASACSMSNFGSMQPIITTTLCGQWAGIPSVYSASGCGTAQNSSSCYLENVMGSGSNYGDAFWAINSFRIFSSSQNVTGTIVSSAQPVSVTAIGSGYGARVSGSGSAAVAGATASTAAGKSGAASIVAPVGLIFAALIATLTLA